VMLWAWERWESGPVVDVGVGFSDLHAVSNLDRVDGLQKAINHEVDVCRRSR
jgi:hypothetical protein